MLLSFDPMCAIQHLARVDRQTSTKSPISKHIAGRYATPVLAALHTVAVSPLKAICLLPSHRHTLSSITTANIESSSSSGFMGILHVTMSYCVKRLHVPVASTPKECTPHPPVRKVSEERPCEPENANVGAQTPRYQGAPHISSDMDSKSRAISFRENNHRSSSMKAPQVDQGSVSGVQLRTPVFQKTGTERESGNHQFHNGLVHQEATNGTHPTQITLHGLSDVARCSSIMSVGPSFSNTDPMNSNLMEKGRFESCLELSSTLRVLKVTLSSV